MPLQDHPIHIEQGVDTGDTQQALEDPPTQDGNGAAANVKRLNRLLVRPLEALNIGKQKLRKDPFTVRSAEVLQNTVSPPRWLSGPFIDATNFKVMVGHFLT